MTREPDRAALLSRAALMRLAEPPVGSLAELIDDVGPTRALEEIVAGRASDAVAARTVARATERTLDQLLVAAEWDLEVARRHGAELLTPEHPQWPGLALASLTMLANRRPGGADAAVPVGLYVRGRLPTGLPASGVTLVGARACTSYGRQAATELAADVADAGYAVISGAAFGIDTAAHRAALAVGGRTVAVLACGIDRAYPEANADLIDSIAGGGGAVVSEYPPGTTPGRHRFLVRNRLIAALGSTTVVVEAGARSGSLNTAATAAAIGRVVMAVPGPITSGVSVGCHVLLRERFALLAASGADVLAAVGPLQAGPDQSRSLGAPGVEQVTDGLDPTALRVYDALPLRHPRTVASLSSESGLPGVAVIAVLPLLEMAGLARRDGASWRRAG